MPLRYLLQNSDLISDHALSACHEALADDLAGIVFASLDVYTLFHDCPSVIKAESIGRHA